jgi:alpha-L-fucosidase
MHLKGHAIVFRKACAAALALSSVAVAAQTPKHYEPTIESLDTHPLPAWYDDAKLGIFIHWGLYSVPGWAEPQDPHHITGGPGNTPYAEWYYNSMRNPGSPTQQYHEKTYGKDYNYYNFAPIFNKEIEKWDPEKMAAILRDAGAKYVVLTSKHHEGFTLWPSEVRNPNQPGLHASRDIVGELSKAVEKDGMKMGLYYSGGYDWTFDRGPIEVDHDYETVQPQSHAYGVYADAQLEELIEKYHPAVLWNDIGWPKSGNALKDEADYYNAVPDGVIDDRFSISHSDFTSPEYAKLDHISEKKWEECRGIGLSFGYNRAETDLQTISAYEVITQLVDIVSKNGNLLLDIGPEADGTVPEIQVSRLRALGAWLKQNGEAIYGTHPWTRAEGSTNQMDAKGEPVELRFTTKPGVLYATLMSKPAAGMVLLHNVAAAPGSAVTLLGASAPLKWTQQGADLAVTLPASLPGEHAWVVKLQPAK